MRHIKVMIAFFCIKNVQIYEDTAFLSFRGNNFLYRRTINIKVFGVLANFGRTWELFRVHTWLK